MYLRGMFLEDPIRPIHQEAGPRSHQRGGTSYEKLGARAKTFGPENFLQLPPPLFQFPPTYWGHMLFFAAV